MGNLDPKVVQIIHRALCLDDELDPEKKLGEKLPPGCLGPFLELCHTKITSSEFRPDIVHQEVKSALITTEIYNRHLLNNSRSTRADAEPFLVTPNDDETDALATVSARFRTILTSVRRIIHVVEQDTLKSVKRVGEMHGGLMKQSSLKDLVTKLGQTADASQVQFIIHQIGLLHVTLTTAMNRKASKCLQQLIKFIDEVLPHLEEGGN